MQFVGFMAQNRMPGKRYCRFIRSIPREHAVRYGEIIRVRDLVRSTGSLTSSPRGS